MRAQLLHGGGPQRWDNFMSELRARHLGIPAFHTGRPAAGEQLDAAYAEAIETAQQDHRTA